MSTYLYDSLICVCGHPINDHYRKNYLIHGVSIFDSRYGNVDFIGCDGKDCGCKEFRAVQVPRTIHGFEQGFTWEMDKELREIYSTEIEKVTWFTDWYRANTVRYLELLSKCLGEK